MICLKQSLVNQIYLIEETVTLNQRALPFDTFGRTGVGERALRVAT